MSSADQRPVVLVTGASSGMGAACARTLAGRRYRVVAVDLKLDHDALGGLAASEDALVVAADVSNPAQAARMVASATDRFGRLDAAVNAAGVSQRMFLRTADLGDDEWHRVMSVNANGIFFSIAITLSYPDEPTVRIFRTSSPGVLRLDDSVAISKAAYDRVVPRHCAFEGLQPSRRRDSTALPGVLS